MENMMSNYKKRLDNLSNTDYIFNDCSCFLDTPELGFVVLYSEGVANSSGVSNIGGAYEWIQIMFYSKCLDSESCQVLPGVEILPREFGASPHQGTHSLTLLPIFDLESHNPISGLLGLFSFILTSFFVIALGYAEKLVHRKHIFLPRSLRLGTPFKVIRTIVKEPDLNIGAVCGELILEGQEAGGENSHPQPTPEKEVDQRNQTIQQLETTLREETTAIASEAVERAEELAKKQQAILDEAERREKDRQEKLSSRILTMVDHDSKTAESKDHTWKPSTVVMKVPGREKSKHPFSSHILAEELPKKFRYPMEIEPYNGTTDPKHHLDAFENRMLLVNAFDAIQCKAFTVTLKKDALT
ncbi:hypothetical protein PIB30_056975 [Stylosanthes scabra]|uniref:Uncharacterized protein n=1 Tax=Stylosanthes scabra TaxID=79078 RepID=A0ABU6QJ87_9FABA|nr:hypothetical protein [Stylosanthes scabra]